MSGRILVIRGGAIGDFILTLPALKLLRENFPDCHLEILGYRQIAALADQRFYANAIRSIDYAPLARFFNPRGDLDPALIDYFSGFQQVISYIYDPDALFESSLRKAGVKNLIKVSPRILDHDHAARQLAQPLEQLALWLDDPSAFFFPSAHDLAEAAGLLSTLPRPLLALHPGSGSDSKNWPLSHWRSLVQLLSSEKSPPTILLIGGECDSARLAALRPFLPPDRSIVLENLPLPTLGAILSQSSAYLGHDTGISHLAAASGVPCLLLFGPTDPAIWAPANPGVSVLQAPDGDLSALDVSLVHRRLMQVFSDAR